MAVSERIRGKITEVRGDMPVQKEMALTAVGNRGLRVTLMAEALDREGVDRGDPSNVMETYLPEEGVVVIDLNHD